MKQLKKLFLVAIMAFVLCGCYKVDMNISIDNDGEASVSMDFLILEEMLSYSDMDIDDLKDSITVNIDESDYTITDLEETIDDEDYVGFHITYKEGAYPGYDFSDIITVEDDTITIVLGEDFLTSMEDTTMNGAGASYGVEVTMTISMPGNIIEATGGEIEGNKVVIDLLTNSESEITIVAQRSNNTVLYIVGGVVALIAIAGVVFFLLKKKKANKDGSDDSKANTTSETLSDETLIEGVETRTITREEIIHERYLDAKRARNMRNLDRRYGEEE